MEGHAEDPGACVIELRQVSRALAALALCAAASCGTLPTVVPGMGQPVRAVRLEGTRGPLSAQESKAILARLESRGAETGIFDRHLALEEGVAGSPLTIGNRVVLLQDGPATYSAMFAAIAGARDHIHMETYIIEDDEVGRKFSAALIARQAQGVPPPGDREKSPPAGCLHQPRSAGGLSSTRRRTPPHPAGATPQGHPRYVCRCQDR